MTKNCLFSVDLFGKILRQFSGWQNSKLKHFKSSELLSQVQPDRHIVNEEMKSESIKDNDHN